MTTEQRALVSQLATRTEDAELVRILDAYLAEFEAGRAPNPEEVIAAHPDLADRLRACLAGLQLVEGVAAPVLFGSAVNAGDRLEVGTLGDFRLLHEIGRGGMGVVYEAQQISLGRHVALKVLPFAATLDQRQLQRFKNEAQAAACLQHQNIVPVYAVGCERGVHYYAMQFIEGQTLAEVIGELRREQGTEDGRSKLEDGGLKLAQTVQQQKPGDETRPSLPSSILHHPSSDFFRTVARLGIQAAEALEHAHSLGVVHRDIKPANLLIEPLAPALGERGRGEGVRLWITDFGLARLPTDAGLTLSSDVLGTLRYMSPEQALAKHGLVDHRTDIYSLSATLYELLTLQPVFDGQDRQELLQKIASEEPRLPSQANAALPTELETIILKALAKEPEGRYAGAQELADDLRRFLDNRPILAKRPTLLQRARKWARRHRSFVLAALLLLVMAVIGLAASTWLIWRAEQRTEAALHDAQVERERAEQRAQETLEAVDRILDAGRLQLNATQPAELESKALVEEALAFYLRLLEEKKTDPKLRLQTARAYHALAGAHNSLGDLAGTERAAHQSIDLLRGLIAEFPGEFTYRILLGEVQRGLGTVIRSRFDRQPEAGALLQQALDCYQA
ncbi:MAG TPA: serine/threonine-protein kinase, partial [Gemmataceae bacterium]|nr:serine/threonine-protein kinase [Gemmataceae bacterium]